MHAFLIIGNNGGDLKNEAEKLAKKLQAKILEFPLVKIEDVRSLNSLIRLSLTETTLVVSENIHEATTEALSAFLKNLEEPQENLYFALTAPTARKVLPTVVSRCQIIKIKSQNQEIKDEDLIKQFLNATIGQRLAFFDKIRDRDEAISLVENLIFYLHEKGELANMEILLKTLTGLKANGNVNLQLTNLAINYDLIKQNHA
ncbi:MAG: polymerase III, delta' subunit protein [Candidatus Woesebacteria bacterium GW2011_GWB1_45_5]|uniref:Polymerase III, delta' subunit protein n=1 Tax=Candidatus Woesebacteria bacterium GW2011_GWB1_45_5 TaxID=1618581 RepID=A0A0G1MPU7_9BACT|nr:MAG: polymerase III, delta' subunit protein [Candidatus Woesebacteria bacterium GW2011_GWB1_45_5]